MRINLRALTGLFILASSLLFSGFLVSWYTTERITALEDMLNQEELSTPNRHMMQGSLNWWINQRVELSPISILLSIAGITTMVVTPFIVYKKSVQSIVRKQKPQKFNKIVYSQDSVISDKLLEIDQLRNKILKIEKTLVKSNNQINNLKGTIRFLNNTIMDSLLTPSASIDLKLRNIESEKLPRRTVSGLVEL